MKPKEFKEQFLPFAKETETKTGISADFILAQAALESGWGKHCPGNMFFGVKDTDGMNGNEQLLTTTEYTRRPDSKFNHILKVEPVTIRGEKFFKYTIQSYFRKYNSPEESFTDHASFFLKHNRYDEALNHKSDPYRFAEEIAKAGYATAPSYSVTLKKIIKTIQSV